MRSKRLRLWAGTVMLWGGLALMVACAVKKPTPTNPQPTTPFQQVLLWNQGLAQSNQSVAEAAKGLNALQPPMIDTPTAQKILTLEFRVAADDKKLTQILEQGPEYTSGQASQVQDLLNDISAAGAEMTTTGNAGVKDPARQQQLVNLITGLNGLSKLIVTGLQTAGVLKP